MATKSACIQEMHSDTRLLIAQLQKVTEGEIVTYEALSQMIGRDVRKSAYGCLGTAKKVLQRDYGIIFGVVVNEGLKRLPPALVVADSERAVKHIRKTARAGVQKLATVDLSRLTPEEKTNFNVRASHLGVFVAMTESNAVKKLESEVAKAQQSLPLAKTLEAFK